MRERFDPRASVLAATGRGIPKAHRDDLTGLDRIAALLEESLDLQREIWRWNVGSYIVAVEQINTAASVATGQEKVFASFRDTTGFGGAVLTGVIAVTDTNFDFNLVVDGQLQPFSANDIANADMTTPYFPGLFITRRDPVLTVVAGLTTTTYAYVFSSGDPRGVFWRNEASMSLKNTSGSAISISKSLAISKKYTQ